MFKIGKDNRKLYLTYTGLFMAVGFFVFIWFLIFGKTMMVNTDGFDQYFPYVTEIRHRFGDLLRGKGLYYWNWSIGLGADYLGNYYSVCCDPFTYVMALFPPKIMDIGYCVAIILRMYAAGLTMLIFLRSRKLVSHQCLIGAISYAFSMWALVSFMQMFFLMPMILFPLLMLGINRVDEGKSPVLLILTIAAMLISSIYFAYMAAVMAVFYFIVSFITEYKEKSVRIFFARLLKFIVAIVIAVMIALPVVIIVGLTIMNAPKGDSEEMELFFKLDQYLRFIPTMFTDQQFYGNYSALSVSGVILAMLPAVLLRLKDKKVALPGIMFILNFIFMLFPVFASIMNGFNYPTARWGYIFAFFLIWAGSEALDIKSFEDRVFGKKYIKLLCVLFAVVSLAMIVANIFKLLSSKQVLVALINLIAIAVTAVILFLGAFKIEADKRKIKGALVILASANIALAGFTHFSGMLNGEFEEYMDQGSIFEQYQKSLLKGLTKLDKDLYRVDSVEHIADTNKQDYVDFYHWAANEPTYARVPSVYSYYSTFDSHWNELNECLCNNAGFAVRVISCSNDGRSRMNFLENVRYFVASNEKTLNNYKSYGFGDGKKQKDTGYYLSSNNFDTSLGYVYDKYITRSDFMNYDYLGREQVLMQAAVIDDDKTAAPDADKLTDPVSDTKELQPEISVEDGISLDGNKISVSRKGAKIKLKFEEIKDSELYVSLTGFRRIPVSYEDMLKNSISDDMSVLDKGRTYISRFAYKPNSSFELYMTKEGRRKRIVNQSGLNNQANTSMEDYLCNIGYYESANGEAEIIFVTTGVFVFDSIRVYSVSQQNFSGQAKKLSDNRLKIDDLGRDRIKGTVDSDGGILYLSILNSGGWKAYVDGNPVDLYSVNVGFVGMDIGPGKHDVELRYTPRGWPYSGIISIMGIACCAGVGILHKRKQRSQVK